MFRSISALIILLFTSTLWAELNEGIVEVQKGEKVYFNTSIVDAEKPTLILLPGIYRGIQKEDSFAKLLRKKKMNYVAIHFSGQPKSVANYKTFESAVFSGGKGLTAAKLAKEVEAVVDALEIQKPIAVSLSYSAIIVPFLDPKKFPIVIETAPMGVFGEDDPEGHAQRQQWVEWLRQWPVWGPIWVESAKSAAYRTHWSKIANERVQGEENISVNQLTDGYMALARAAEDFDLRKENYKKTSSRIWVLAENEDEYRRQVQNEAIEIAGQTLGKKIKPIIIPQAGHTIPMDQPEAYADVIEKIVKKLK